MNPRIAAARRLRGEPVPPKLPPPKRKPCGCKDVKAIAQASAEIVKRG